MNYHSNIKIQVKNQNIEAASLKGEYEDYIWGYGQKPLDYPLS